MEELAKERREREAVDKGDRKGQQWKRRKKGTLRIGYINADGTRDKAELVEMCRRAEADVYFILDTKYQRKDNHFAALESDMRKIAGKRGKTYSRAMPHSITKNGAMRIGGITTIVAERIRKHHTFIDDPRNKHRHTAQTLRIAHSATMEESKRSKNKMPLSVLQVRAKKRKEKGQQMGKTPL